ncbi:MAG TPA: hypothetical protein VL992_06260 [Tepidisphaeraceae bacterium]|nr:hypothetical protein [Tepidisphaeraceae bacterium]
MLHAFERSGHHHILKAQRPLEGGDPNGKLLPNPKMSRFPGHSFPHSDKSFGHARDRSLVSLVGRFLMKVDTSSQIEEAIRRRGDKG